ncbi:MAG: hypothetical protein O2904_00420 [bacterium]|nr:hypothetical protein [bacterium]
MKRTISTVLLCLAMTSCRNTETTSPINISEVPIYQDQEFAKIVDIKTSAKNIRVEVDVKEGAAWTAGMYKRLLDGAEWEILTSKNIDEKRTFTTQKEDMVMTIVITPISQIESTVIQTISREN